MSNARSMIKQVASLTAELEKAWHQGGEVLANTVPYVMEQLMDITSKLWRMQEVPLEHQQALEAERRVRDALGAENRELRSEMERAEDRFNAEAVSLAAQVQALEQRVEQVTGNTVAELEKVRQIMVESLSYKEAESERLKAKLRTERAAVDLIREDRDRMRAGLEMSAKLLSKDALERTELKKALEEETKKRKAVEEASKGLISEIGQYKADYHRLADGHALLSAEAGEVVQMMKRLKEDRDLQRFKFERTRAILIEVLRDKYKLDERETAVMAEMENPDFIEPSWETPVKK